MRPYTTYLVTLYPLKVELRRRYSEFDSLREILIRRYPAILFNPLPPKKAMNSTSEETVLLRMKSVCLVFRWLVGLERWLNDAVSNPYIRMDTTFRDFISAQSINWGRFPEKNSLSLHNVEAKKKKGAVENEGFDKYQEYMQHVKCPEDVEA